MGLAAGFSEEPPFSEAAPCESWRLAAPDLFGMAHASHEKAEDDVQAAESHGEDYRM
jgi:hypothetical protein